MLLRLFFVLTFACFLTAHGLAIQKLAALGSTTGVPPVESPSGD